MAQIGAAIGREFSHELIAAVSALAPMDLDAALERLTASGLISRRGTPPDATYSFKHALVQDAAYATMLKSRRRQLHASIAKVLVERFPAMAESLPEVVAHHFTGGRACERGDRLLAQGGSACVRAIGQPRGCQILRAGADVSSKRCPRAARRWSRPSIFALTFELHSFRSENSSGSSACLREAEGLARTLDDQRRLGQLSVYLCHNLWMTGHPTEALAFGQSAQAIAESLGDVPLQVTGNLYLGAACLGTGDYRRAEELLLKVLQLLEGDLSRERFGLAGFPAVMAR